MGISITFMIVDLLGGVFSDLSLAFKEDFDIIASIAYTLVVVSVSPSISSVSVLITTAYIPGSRCDSYHIGFDP